MKRLLLTLLCTAALFAQEPVMRIVQIKHINPDNLATVLQVLSNSGVIWRTDTPLRVVALRGPAELVDAMEAAIKKLDVPPPPVRNVELTFHMLLAAPQGDSPAIAPELTSVAQQLRNVFGLKSIRVLETAVLRSRENNGGQTNGLMSSPSKVEAPATYNIFCSKVQVSAPDKTANIRIDNLRFEAKIPVPNAAGIQYHDAMIKTDIDVREGQKVVVGKTSVDSAAQSIFLVVTAKVVD